MSALVLDAGALLKADRDDRAIIARLRAAEREGADLITNAMAVARAWRDDQGRQASLARLLQAVDVRAVSPADGRAAGVLLGKSGTDDPTDATVALLARTGDRIMTSDPADLRRLAAAAGIRAIIVPC